MVEEQPLRSLTGKFYGMHSHVGSLIFRDVMPSILSNEGIFFYSHNYSVPREDGGYGCLEEIPLPLLSSQEWPTPDAWTVISLKTRMANDILASLKYTQASKSVRLNWACPIHVFACMFHAMNCHETPTMYVCKGASAQELSDLFGDGWDIVEGVLKDEHFKCNVVSTSISFRFLKARSALSISFRYERWHWKRNAWVSLQAPEEAIEAIDLYISCASIGVQNIKVRQSWSLSNVRDHFLNMGFEGLHSASFKLNGRKVMLFMFLFKQVFITRCSLLKLIHTMVCT